MAFVVLRLAVATQSGFGFHQGWNEGHYSLIARGFFDHPLVPEYGGEPVYNVPPLFPYLVAGSFALFGESAVAARLPSILATAGTILATYWLGREVYDDERVALAGAGVLAVLPYIQLYGGRAQTDALMTTLFAAAAASIVRGYRRRKGRRWLVVGGGLFAAGFAAKQPTLLLPLVILLWVVTNSNSLRRPATRTSVLVVASGVALIPLLVWFALNYALAPDAFVADWTHELFSRTSPFANVPLLIAVGFGLGMTPPVLLLGGLGVWDGLFTSRDDGFGLQQPNVLVLWLFVYGVFVFYRTPHGHQYYALPLAVPLALLAARGSVLAGQYLGQRLHFRRELLTAALVALLVLGSIAGSGFLFELSGEYSVQNGGGERVAPEIAGRLSDDLESDSVVLAPTEYRRPIQWYLRDELPPKRVRAYQVGTLSRSDVEALQREADGPVYLVVVQPSQSELTLAAATRPAYVSDPYRFTVSPLVERAITVDGKFSLYVEHRRLVVYRLP